MRHSYNCSELLGQIRIWEVNINNSWIRRTLAIAENNQSGERTGICILTHACGSVKHNSDIIIVYHPWKENPTLYTLFKAVQGNLFFSSPMKNTSNF